MTTKRLNSEALGGAILEKRGRLTDTIEDDMEAELDDEVEKELREFEELLDTTTVEGKPGTGRTEKENAGGSDMELDDLDQDAGKKARAVIKAKENPLNNIRMLPDTFVKEVSVGKDLIEASGALEGEDEASLVKEQVPLVNSPASDRRRTPSIRAKSTSDSSILDPSLAKQVEELAAQAQALARSPEHYSDDSSNDPDFPSPGKRKSRSRARSKRPSKSSRSEPRESPKKKRRMDKELVTKSSEKLGKQGSHGMVQHLNGNSGSMLASQRRVDARVVGQRQAQNHVKALQFGGGEDRRIHQRADTQKDKYQPKVVLQQLTQSSLAIRSTPAILRKESAKHPANAVSKKDSWDSASPVAHPEEEGRKEDQEPDQLEEPAQAVVPANSFPDPKYCAIERIIQRRFKNSFTLDSERAEMLGSDRPHILSPDLHAYAKYFESHPWLVACNELTRFFCWPCLFFSTKMTWSLRCSENAESTIGKDLKIHAQSPAHQESIKQMSEFQLRNKSSIIKTLLTNGSARDRDAVILKGRPQPVLDGMGDEGNDKAEVKKLYDVAKWICGCSNSKKLYCWPCLLSNRVWQFSGDAESLKIAGLMHESEHNHMEACFALGKREYDLRQKSAHEKEDFKEKTRSFIMSFVELFCAEKMKISNGDMTAADFLDSIELMGEYNPRLRFFTDGKSPNARMAAAQALIPAVQDSVEFCLKDGILEEIRKSNFISLIFDHSSGVSNKAILSVIARYVDGGGRVHEAFVKVLTVGYNTPSSLLVDEFFQVITELQCRSSLVGFTYDGYLVKPGDIPEFNSNVQKFCPNAKFFHYTEHTFKRVLKQTLCHVPICRAALQKVKDLASFFEHNPTAMKGLADIMSAVEESDDEGTWRAQNFIMTVFLHHALILEILESICKAPTLWKVQTVIQAASFIDFFKDPANRFFITLMARIFELVEELSTELRKEIAFEELKPLATHTALKLQKLNRNFDSVVDSACSYVVETKQESLRQAMATLRDQFSSVIRLVVKLVKNRIFSLDAGYFSISKEPPKPNVTNYIKLDGQYLVLQAATLPSNFNSERLLNELQFFHKTSMAGSCFGDIIARMIDYNIVGLLPEFFKLLQLALTIPKSLLGSTTPAVRRIAAYVESKKDVSSVDALFWMEKAFLTDLEEDPNFRVRVTDRVLSLTEGGILEKHFQI